VRRAAPGKPATRAASPYVVTRPRGILSMTERIRESFLGRVAFDKVPDSPIRIHRLIPVRLYTATVIASQFEEKWLVRRASWNLTFDGITKS
jgi:hypothetical protein